MKILFLSNQINEQASAYNRRLHGLQRALEAEGEETEYLSIRSLAVKRPHLLFGLNARAIARHARGFDLIHAGDAGATVAAAVARLFGSCPVVFDVHGDEAMETRLAWRTAPNLRNAILVLQAMLLSAVARRIASLHLVVSEPFRKRYQLLGVPAEQIILVRNGVDTQIFNSNGKHDSCVLEFCYSGGYQSWQAIDVLINALRRSQDERLHFCMIGFSHEDHALKTSMKCVLGDHVTLKDRLSTDELVSRLSKTDVLMIPRTTHPAMRGGCPSKFAEYLSMGKPLIVTNVDETAAFVTRHRCGLVCEPTEAGWVKAIRKAGLWSDDERAEMGANARRLAEREFDWKIIGREYRSALEKMIAKKA
jgi:glycosyltransferase involved in cell wall biosynthesis